MICTFDERNERNKISSKIQKLTNSKRDDSEDELVIPAHLSLQEADVIELSDADKVKYTELDQRAMKLEKSLAEIYCKMSHINKWPRLSKVFYVHCEMNGLTKSLLAARPYVKQRLGLVDLVSCFYGNPSSSRRRRGGTEKYSKHIPISVNDVDDHSEGGTSSSEGSGDQDNN